MFTHLAPPEVNSAAGPRSWWGKRREIRLEQEGGTPAAARRGGKVRREGIGEMGRVHLRRKEEERVIGLVSIQPPPSSGATFGSREKKRNSGGNLLFFSELGFAP